MNRDGAHGKWPLMMARMRASLKALWPSSRSLRPCQPAAAECLQEWAQARAVVGIAGLADRLGLGWIGMDHSRQSLQADPRHHGQGDLVDHLPRMTRDDRCAREDWYRTQQELRSPSRLDQRGRIWLRHNGKQNTKIDQMLLEGTHSLSAMAARIDRLGSEEEKRQRVRGHLDHLSDPVEDGGHGLKLSPYDRSDLPIAFEVG